MYLQRTAFCCTLGQGTSSGFSLDPEDSWNASVLQSTVNRRKWGLTKIEGFTPLMSFIGCLHFLQITTVLLLQSAISHLWSSWRICCKQKYLWQLPHSIGRISFWLQNAQCFPKSSNSITGKSEEEPKEWNPLSLEEENVLGGVQQTQEIVYCTC